MANRPPVGIPKLSRRSRILLILGAVLLILLIAGSRLIGTYVDWLWYGEVGYRYVFSTIALTRLTLWAVTGAFVGLVLGLNLWIAYRMRPVFVPTSGPEDPLARYRTVATQRSKLFGIGIPVVVGVLGGIAAQGDWQLVQMFLHGGSFGTADPQFGKDVGFYTFRLPFYHWLLTWGFVAVVLSFIGALVTHYIFGGIRLTGRSGQLSVPARAQLAILAGVFVLLKAVDYYLDRYDLLLSQRSDRFTGATYTDLHAVMPAKLILLCIAVFCAFAFFAAVFLRNLQIPALATVLLVLSSVVVGAVWPALLQQFSVEPNANERESQSIERNLVATKRAFNITEDNVDTQRVEGRKTKPYPGTTQLSPEQVAQNKGTIPNIRLLDPNILSETFTQLKQQYNFYGFPDKLDVDRYRTPSGELQDYLVAVRGLDTDNLTPSQQSWINSHMKYTHGNGFVTAPADRVSTTPGDGANSGAYPVFSVSDTENNGQGRIPVDQPRVYYGELVNNYAIVGGEPGDEPREYDTPNKTYTYKGAGGVPMGNPFKRMVFAAYYGEQNILFNQAIGSQSQLIFKRNPRERVKEIAPWLKLDGDSYPAVIDGRIKWILDGYTTLNNYPYSQRVQFGEATSDSLDNNAGPGEQVNYIRNSVKVTVDAYSGKVQLYEYDKQDPVLDAWQGIFPGMIKPKSAISPELQQHLRYPADLFQVQRQMLTSYHVDDAASFYAQQSFWGVPPDPTVGGQGGNNRSGGKQPPYYVIAQIPGQSRPVFQLTSALTALKRPNLASWISVSSAPQSYGEMTVLELPTDTQTPGPAQVQRQMESTPKVTRDRTLFDNPAVQPQFGNLLTLPVEGGLLYVEPIYIQPSSQDAYPQLARVLVSFGGKVGFAPTLEESLNQVFGAGAGQAADTAEGQQDDQPPQDGQQQDGQPPQDGQQPDQNADPQVSQAVADIQSAMKQLRSAQQSGNLGEIGKALQQLEAATRRFEQAQQSGN